MEEVERLFDAYSNAVSHRVLAQAINTPDPSGTNTLLISTKLWAMHVHGEAYPHQFYEFALSLYTPHDPWFRDHFGFSIREAITISRTLCDEYARRNFESKNQARTEAKKQTDDLIAKGEATEEQRTHLESGIGCGLHYGNAENLLVFTVEQLTTFSGVPLEVCRGFLDRMSQEFGYRNPRFPNTFSDGIAAPWDYNTLNERPIIRRDEKYWLVVPAILRSALFQTYYFDFLNDKVYWPTFEKSLGGFVEAKTAEYLRRVFPTDDVLLNPYYPSGNEFADVVVLHDRKVLIFQCKSKTMTFPAKIGADLNVLRSDMQKGIKDAFDQGIRARDYLRANEEPEIVVGNIAKAIDMRQVNGIYIINVTLMPFQTLATRFANDNRVLGLFAGNEFPWSLALGDLDNLTQVLTSAVTFIHYMTRRLEIEKTHFDIVADEMDLLGYYIRQGMYFDSDEFKDINSLAIPGLSSDVDQYLFEKYELGKPVHPPKPAMPPGFDAFLSDVENLGTPYATDCATALLDLNYKSREQFMKMLEQAKTTTRADGGLHSFSMALKGGKRGISFVSLDANGEPEKLFRTAGSFAMMKKHADKCADWVGFGWDLNSARNVDVAFYASYAWAPDTVVDGIIEKNLKSGKQIEL